MEWSSSLSSGNVAFDLARRHCLAALARLEQAPVNQFQPHLRALIDTLSAAFGEEERVMENMGFPELMAHRAQHQRVLVALQGAASQAAHGNVCAARAVVALLPHWFVFHWAHMDTTLIVTASFAASGTPAPSAARRPASSTRRAPGPMHVHAQEP